MSPCKFWIWMLDSSTPWLSVLQHISSLPWSWISFPALLGSDCGSAMCFSQYFSSFVPELQVAALNLSPVSPCRHQTPSLLWAISGTPPGKELLWPLDLLKTNKPQNKQQKKRLSTGPLCAVLQTQWLWWDCIHGACMVWSDSHQLLC